MKAAGAALSRGRLEFLHLKFVNRLPSSFLSSLRLPSPALGRGS
jgi:hypothetical protein